MKERAFAANDLPVKAFDIHGRRFMERVNRIWESKAYQKYLKKNEKAEKKRKFCKHNAAHFLDVARIAVIMNGKEQYGVEEAWIYAAALLHDIGRWKQYEDGTPHEEASALLAPGILSESGFDDSESKVILDAIRSHRDASVKERKDLSGLLYRADKLSRACFACAAEKECNWKDDKKNRSLVI